MRKILFILAICSLAGCTNKEERAVESAGVFLDAFLANDYQKAAGCCSDTLKVEVDKAFERFRQLDTNIRALLVNECQQYRTEIGAAERIGDSDTIKVNYKIIKDSSISGYLKVLEGKILSIGE